MALPNNPTPQTLMDAAACYRCIPEGLRDSVMLYLLLQIALGGGGGIVGGNVICATVDPTIPPAGTSALYVNTVSGGVWFWDNPNATWQKLIA